MEKPVNKMTNNIHCEYCDKCGGCSYTSNDEASYREQKLAPFKQVLNQIKQPDINYGKTIFIPKQTRRRASMVFAYKKGVLEFGFNEKSSHNIVSIASCELLTPLINQNLSAIGNLILEICKTPKVEKAKKGKSKTSYITEGDVWVCEADNGLDIVIETKETLGLNHRMTIFEILQNNNDIIRVSHRTDVFGEAEPIIEKAKPIIKIADTDVFISAGTFLQPSKQGEQALIDLVMKYIGNGEGKIADLFCGIGTFSYPLAKNKNNKIFAFDSSKQSLDSLKKSLNKHMISNIEIKQKNLFKYPLDEMELKGFDIVIFDPPRAGASAQVAKIASLEKENLPQKIVAVSCNPQSFVKDANTLLSSGYIIDEITLVDQFTYSNHCELVALFTKEI